LAQLSAFSDGREREVIMPDGQFVDCLNCVAADSLLLIAERLLFPR